MVNSPFPAASPAYTCMIHANHLVHVRSALPRRRLSRLVKLGCYWRHSNLWELWLLSSVTMDWWPGMVGACLDIGRVVEQEINGMPWRFMRRCLTLGGGVNHSQLLALGRYHDAHVPCSAIVQSLAVMVVVVSLNMSFCQFNRIRVFDQVCVYPWLSINQVT